jgi:hypothetical protein
MPHPRCHICGQSHPAQQRCPEPQYKWRYWLLGIGIPLLLVFLIQLATR